MSPPAESAHAAASSDDATKPPVMGPVSASAAIQQQINQSLSAARSLAISVGSPTKAKPRGKVNSVGVATESTGAVAKAARKTAGPRSVKLARQKAMAGLTDAAGQKSGVSSQRTLQVRIQ
jgi:hypothetical protein